MFFSGIFHYPVDDWAFDAGGDDRRILLWDVERALADAGPPAVMMGEHNSNIFCVAFNNCNSKIFSGGKAAVQTLVFCLTSNILGGRVVVVAPVLHVVKFLCILWPIS